MDVKRRSVNDSDKPLWLRRWGLESTDDKFEGQKEGEAVDAGHSVTVKERENP